MSKSTTTNARKAITLGQMWSITINAIGQAFSVLGRVCHTADKLTEVGEAHAVTFNHTEIEKMEKKHPNLRQQLTVDFSD